MGNRFRRLAVLGITVVIVAAGAGTAYAAMSSSGPSYRLATATPAYVTATLPEVGTLTPVRQADVGFAAGGTVQAVAVKPGQHVTAGQRLGTLDPTSLQAALTAAQSALANANLQVSNDIASQDTTAAASGTGSAASPGASTAPSPGSALRPLQRAVLSAQRKADSALAQARIALAQAKQVCAPAPSPSPTPSPGPASPSPAPSPGPASPGPAPSPGPASPAPWPSATAPTAPAGLAPAGTGTALAPRPAAVTCLAATQRVLAAETTLLQAQEALSGRLTALADALAQAVAAAAKSSSGSGTSGGDPASPGGTGGSGGGGGGPVSAAQLAADQASADAAAAEVTVAQQDLGAATLVSPISGTVVTVSATPGTAETAGAAAFVIAGLDAYEVVAQVPVTDLPQLKTGQRASVLPDGTSTPLSGSVVSIGLIPDSTGSPVTYPVTIGLAGQPSGLLPGSYAGVTITTARSSGVSVPTSAVRRSGHQATVIVYAGDKARVTKVTVGTVGPVMTRITAGLRAGEQVVLANLSQPLPGNNPASQGPGPGGRFFGGQFPAGGSVNFVAPHG